MNENDVPITLFHSFFEFHIDLVLISKRQLI